MATRSTIGVKQDNGEVVGVYCHWDGYPEGVGATLKARVTTESEAMALVSGGDISTIHGEDEEGKLKPLYYRDRKGEAWSSIEPKTHDTEEDFWAYAEQEGFYGYLFVPDNYGDGDWVAKTPKGLPANLPPDENKYELNPTWGAEQKAPEKPEREAEQELEKPEPDEEETSQEGLVDVRKSMRLPRVESKKASLKESHTPGPWMVKSGHNNYIVDQNAKEIAFCAFENDKANAALIAAAPDLLKALKTSLNALEVSAAQLGRLDAFRDSEGYRQARAAIAKAEGE